MTSTNTIAWTRRPKVGDRVRLADNAAAAHHRRRGYGDQLGTVVHRRSRLSTVSGAGPEVVFVRFDGSRGNRGVSVDALILVEGAPTPKQTEAAVRTFSDPSATAEQRAEAARIVEAADRAASLKAAN